MQLGWCSNDPSIGELMAGLEPFLLLFLLRRWSFSMTLVATLVKVNELMMTVEWVC
jgi:hypothetical protein